MKASVFLGPLAVVLHITATLAADKRLITPQDLWAMKRVSSPALSRDGKQVVVSVQEWSVDKNKSTANLWLVEVASGESRRLTTAPCGPLRNLPGHGPTFASGHLSRRKPLDPDTAEFHSLELGISDLAGPLDRRNTHAQEAPLQRRREIAKPFFES